MHVYSACRRTKDGKVTASGEWIQSPTHAPEPHAVHAARRASRCRTYRYPVTGQSTASPASASTGSGRAGSQGQSEYDQHGSPREVSLPFFLSRSISACQRSVEKPQTLVVLLRCSGSCASSRSGKHFHYLPPQGSLRAGDKSYIGRDGNKRRTKRGAIKLTESEIGILVRCSSEKLKLRVPFFDIL